MNASIAARSHCQKRKPRQPKPARQRWLRGWPAIVRAERELADAAVALCNIQNAHGSHRWSLPARVARSEQGNICSLLKPRARTSIRRVIKLSHATESGIPPLLLIKEINMNTVQRAFELAATGDCRSLEDVRSAHAAWEPRTGWCAFGRSDDPESAYCNHPQRQRTCL